MRYYSNRYSTGGYEILWFIMHTPFNLQRKCDGCGTSLNVRHSLKCYKGGLVIAYHNEVHWKLPYIAWRDFTSTAVHAGPLIHQVRKISERDNHQGSQTLNTCDDIIIRGLWYQQTDGIIDVKLGNADADNYRFEPIAALLSWWGKIKKNKNGKHWHNQRKYFLLFYIDGMLGKESLTVLANLSRLVAAKINESIPHVQGWINGHITIEIDRSYSRMICGYRITSPLQDWEADWDPASGLELEN